MGTVRKWLSSMEGKENMGIIITNGEYYIKNTSTGKLNKTQDINEATHFYSVNKAMHKILSKPVQCKGYYLFDTEDTYIRHKQNRNHFSQYERKFLYDKANGKCALCGKELLFQESTLDHIIPLNKNGKDDIENLQICCYQCNQIKGAFLTIDLLRKISEIFIYQMNKKYGNKLRWKIISRWLRRMSL